MNFIHTEICGSGIEIKIMTFKSLGQVGSNQITIFNSKNIWSGFAITIGFGFGSI